MQDPIPTMQVVVEESQDAAGRTTYYLRIGSQNWADFKRIITAGARALNYADKVEYQFTNGDKQ